VSSATAATRATQEAAAVTIIGAGLAGTLLAILLARRGHSVQVYERLPDLRHVPVPEGRSINLALTARGLRALEHAGLLQTIQPSLIAMRARTLHALDGTLKRIPYGQRPQEVIYSVSRKALNCALLDAAEQLGVRLQFAQRVVSASLAQRELRMRDERSQSQYTLPLVRIIAADGAGSVLRRGLVEHLGVPCSEELLPSGYKELTLPPDSAGQYQFASDALHIWPRGEFMLIALPNPHGNFTVTLFLPHQDTPSQGTSNQGTPSQDTSHQVAPNLAALRDAASVVEFFEQHFPDITPLMPQLAAEFFGHDTGILGTVRCERWSFGDQLLLLGDAAHAITPFHGQGMNCAFEDCLELDTALSQTTDWAEAFERFEQARRPNTDAMADMALENYLEMRDTIRDPHLQLQKALALELERRHPQRFVPRYSMVTFHAEIPYAVAYARGAAQDAILAELTRNVSTLNAVDFARAAQLIEQQLPSL
jgi:kynurenine 3-monooxygenase